MNRVPAGKAALHTEPTFRMLRRSLKRVYRIEPTPRFDALLAALDRLDKGSPAG